MGLFDHLHIKGHTAGSSNELSFDVLENARNDLDSGTRRRRSFSLAGLAKRAQRTNQSAQGKHALPNDGTPAPTGNTPFTRGTVTVTSSDEVLQRSRRRGGSPLRAGVLAGGLWGKRSSSVADGRRHKPLRAAGMVLGVLVTIGVMCGAIVINHQLYLERLDFTNRLVVLTGEISRVDEELVQVDLLARSPLSESSREMLTTVLGSLPGMESELVGIQEKTTRIRIDKPAGYNAAALAEVESAISARVELLDEAAKLLEEAEAVHEFVERAEQAWQQVVDSTELASRSIARANEASSQSALQESRALTEQALESFRQASSQLTQLQNEEQRLNFGAHLRYLDTKIEALQHVLDVDDALLALDREAATEANLAYNATEDEAASQAALIVTSPADAALELMNERMAARQAAYERVRQQVVTADAALRTRLP